jgi:hypothetical protein
MFKMGSHCSFAHLKHKLWPKKRLGIKKLRINLIYFSIKGVRHTVGKLFTRATTLLRIASRSKVCSQSYGVPKSRESQLGWFRVSHLGVLGQKNHLDVGSMASHRVYYKGKGDGFLKVRAVMSFVCPCCLWLFLTSKVLQLCINHFVWVLCRHVWMSEVCQLFLVPSWSSNMPFYPSKCCELGACPDSSFFCCFLLGLTFETLKELRVRHRMSHRQTWTHKIHHGSDLGETTTFPLIICYVPLHEAHIQMTFCLGAPKWEFRNCPTTLSPITLCVDLQLRWSLKKSCSLCCMPLTCKEIGSIIEF